MTLGLVPLIGTQASDILYWIHLFSHDSMYILMRGKVTIYILYAKKGDDEEKDQAPTIAEKEGKEVNIRQQLGTYVCSLGMR